VFDISYCRTRKLFGEPYCRRPLEIRWCRGEANIEMDLKEIIYWDVDSTYVNQDQEKQIKSRLKSGNARYHLVQNLLSSRLLSKNTKIRVYRTIILPVALYGCETWSLTLR
jgi:hypothetical protein